MSVNKKSKDIDEHNYKVGDVVLAKIRGYPPWPATIVDGDNVPPAVAKERLTSKKTKFYCVRFFPAGDYSWLVSKDLSLLQKHEIEAYINEPHKKSGDLLAGYKIALNPAEWESQMTEQQEIVQEEEGAEEDVDQLDEGEEEEEGDGAKKRTKKRKRESEVKPRKKKESEKKSSVRPDSKEKKTPGRKRGGKKNGIRSKEAIESEDDNVAEVENAEAAESSRRAVPPAKKLKKDKGGDEGEFAHLANNPDAVRVKEWRHKLQRAFLGKIPAQVEDMPEFDQLFTTIEEHDLTIEQLQYSKLGKVMRHISSLEPNAIPNEEQYHIRKRADALLEKWQGLIAQSEPAAASSVNGAKNGSKAEKKEAKEEDTGEKPAAVNGGAADKKNEPAEKNAAAPPTDPLGEKMDTSAD